jgi:hypothetical protein
MAYRISVEKDDFEISMMEISDQQVACLEHDLLDVDEWVIHAVMHAIDPKIRACRDRMIEAHRKIIEADPAVAALPKSRDEQAAMIVARGDYKNRATRESEEEV